MRAAHASLTSPKIGTQYKQLRQANEGRPLSQTGRLILKIEAADFDDEQVDQLSRQLLDELREADIDSVKLIADRGAPEGTKSGGLETVGMIAVQALPAAIPGLIGLLRAWCQRGQGRNIKVTARSGNSELDLEYPVGSMTQSELERLVDTVSGALGETRGQGRAPD